MKRERAIEAQVDQDMVAATLNNGNAGSYSSNSDPLLVARSSLESVKGDMYVCMHVCIQSECMNVYVCMLMAICMCILMIIYNVRMHVQDLQSYTNMYE